MRHLRSCPGWTRASWALAFVSVLCCAPVAAQIHIPTYTGTPLMITGGVLNQQILQASVPGARPAADSKRAAQVSTVVPDGPSRMPRQLAQSYPPEARAEAERFFAELLSGYQGIERQFGIPRRDLAGAVATFIAGSWMAYRGEPFPDRDFPPLVDQSRRILASLPQLREAAAPARQDTYEQLAILGMFMATTRMALDRRPDRVAAANLRQAARRYLEQFLAVDAERVQLGPEGLRLN